MSESDFTILVDMDGVLVNLNPIILERINKEFGTDYTEEDLTDFNYGKSLDKSEHSDLAYDIWHENDLYKDIEWSDETKDAIEELKQIGRVVVVSSPMVGHGTSKLRWLYSHGFDKEDVVLASDKNLVHGHVLIDDRAENVRKFPRASLLFDKKYNESYNTEDHETRVHDWSDVTGLVKHYESFRSLIPE